MIAWTIPTNAFVTSSSASTQSSFSSTSESASFSWSITHESWETQGLTRSSSSQSSSTEQSFSRSFSFSAGLHGTTTFESTSSSYFSTSTYEASYFDLNPANNADFNYHGSFSTSTSGSTSGVASGSYPVHTSTTETFAELFNETTSFLSTSNLYGDEEAAFNSYWTTATTAENNGPSYVTFFTTNNTSSLYYDTTYSPENSTRERTRTTTTGLTQTQIAGAAATVWQAEESEVLYCIESPATTWSGFAVATEVAQSGTRFTLAPVYSTRAIPVIHGSATTTSSTSQASLTTSLSWAALTQSTTSGVAVNRAYLPNPTTTTTATVASTTQSTISVLLFASTEFTLGRVEEYNTTSSASVSTVTSYALAPLKLTCQAGTQTYEILGYTTVSATRLFPTWIAATNTETASASSSTTTTYDAGAGASGSASASGCVFAGNQTVYGPADISTSPNHATSRYRLATSGAVLDSLKGGHMTWSGPELSLYTFYDGTSSVATAFAGSERRGVTLVPTATPDFTISKRSVTYTASSGSQTTTSSGLIGVAGNTSTFVDMPINDNDTFATGTFNAFGGAPGNNCTFAEWADPGAYKCDGTTTSFDGNVTTYGNSAPLRSWESVVAITPLTLRENRSGLIWAEPRNRSALPIV